MVYKTKMTEDFIHDVYEICEYINNKLKLTEASKRLREKVRLKVLFLENTPMMFSVIEKYDRVKRRYRRAIINNYVMLYTIDNDIVYISHLYYNGRDYLNVLL